MHVRQPCLKIFFDNLKALMALAVSEAQDLLALLASIKSPWAFILQVVDQVLPWDETPTCQNTFYRIFLAFDSIMKIYVSCGDSCETVMTCLLEELAGIFQVLLQFSQIL